MVLVADDIVVTIGDPVLTKDLGSSEHFSVIELIDAFLCNCAGIDIINDQITLWIDGSNLPSADHDPKEYLLILHIESSFTYQDGLGEP